MLEGGNVMSCIQNMKGRRQERNNDDVTCNYDNCRDYIGNDIHSW